MATPCGYCNSAVGDTSVCHGVWARRLNVVDYQSLLDRGWRRSGNFLYTTNNRETCCPAYAVRLKAQDFRPSREHRRMQRRLAAYCAGRVELCGGGAAVEEGQTEAPPCGGFAVSQAPVTPQPGAGSGQRAVDTAALHAALHDAVCRCMATGLLPQVRVLMPHSSPGLVSVVKGLTKQLS
jgi:hypothetical protein